MSIVCFVCVLFLYLFRDYSFCVCVVIGCVVRLCLFVLLFRLFVAFTYYG